MDSLLLSSARQSPVLIAAPWIDIFSALVLEAESSLVLCSPYIGREPIRRIIEAVNAKASAKLISVTVLTDLSRDNMLSGSTDVEAILLMSRSLRNVEVRFLPSLHAKVYVSDEVNAVVTSANLTTNGLFRNCEYGVQFTELEVVKAIKRDVLQYAALGSPIDEAQLALFATVVQDVREIASTAQRAVTRTIRREFDRRIGEADTAILRARSAGRTAHAIFAEAILHVLRTGPKSTVEIHHQVKAIHPDLCDDSVDRVIDGRHFGKRWKHDVRTAQVFLRRKGQIHLTDRKWQRTSQ